MGAIQGAVRRGSARHTLRWRRRWRNGSKKPPHRHDLRQCPPATPIDLGGELAVRGQEAPEPHKGPHHQYAHFHAAKSSQIRIENDPVTAQDHDSKQGAFCLGWNLLGRVGWPRVPIEPGCPVPRLVSHTEILGEGSGKVAWQVPSERIESEMYGLGHHVLARGRVQAGETAVILGAGKLGLSVLDVLCHGSGACLTMVCDVQPLRLNVAGKLGADHVVDVAREDPVARVREWTGGVCADCVIECVGHYHDVAGREAPLAQAVKMIRPGGRVVTAGMGEQLSAVHFKTLVVKERRSSPRARPPGAASQQKAVACIGATAHRALWRRAVHPDDAHRTLQYRARDGRAHACLRPRIRIPARESAPRNLPRRSTPKRAREAQDRTAPSGREALRRPTPACESILNLR